MRRFIRRTAGAGGPRRLLIELLEDRRLLSGSAQVPDHSLSADLISPVLEASTLREIGPADLQQNAPAERAASDIDSPDQLPKGNSTTGGIQRGAAETPDDSGIDHGDTRRGAEGNGVLASSFSRINASAGRNEETAIEDEAASNQPAATNSLHAVPGRTGVAGSVTDPPDRTEEPENEAEDSDAIDIKASTEQLAAANAMVLPHDRGPAAAPVSSTNAGSQSLQDATTEQPLARPANIDATPQLGTVEVAMTPSKPVPDYVSVDAEALRVFDILAGAPDWAPQQKPAAHSEPTVASAEVQAAAVAPPVLNRLAELVSEVIVSPPQVCDLVSSLVATNLPAIEHGVEEFIVQLERVSDDLFESLGDTSVPTWLVVVTVTVATGQVVWMQLKRKPAGLVFASGRAGDSSSWLPDSVSPPREDSA